MLVPSVFSRIGKKEESAGSPEANGEAPKYPEVLPILPLRGVVVYPQTAVPLTVGQPRSVKLVDDVVASTNWLGLVAAMNPELEFPGPNDLYQGGRDRDRASAAARAGWNRPAAGAGHGSLPAGRIRDRRAVSEGEN